MATHKRGDISLLRYMFAIFWRYKVNN